MAVGQSLVIPWLIFSATAKPVSNRPATTSVSHAIVSPPSSSLLCTERTRKPGVTRMEPGWRAEG
jgi:hypothetical protein